MHQTLDILIGTYVSTFLLEINLDDGNSIEYAGISEGLIHGHLYTWTSNSILQMALRAYSINRDKML